MQTRKGYSFIELITTIALLSSITILTIESIQKSALAEVTNKEAIAVNWKLFESEQLLNKFIQTNWYKFGEEYFEACKFVKLEFNGNIEECVNSPLKLTMGTRYSIGKNGEITLFADNDEDEQVSFQINEINENNHEITLELTSKNEAINTRLINL